jgi:ATP-dependent RNA helicase DeaD
MHKLENFKKLGLSDNILVALKTKGFEEPTKIQEKIIPILLNQTEDVIAQAQTGTGKTAAFGLPLIEKLPENQKHIQALVLTPTRELTIQVSTELNSYKGTKRIKAIPIYGGQSIENQSMQLRRGVDIVVGTPGRIIDHLEHGRLDLSKIDYLILDEADEMLNIGFLDDLETIFKYTNKNKKTLLFSATMPDHILKLAKKYMKEYILVTTQNENITNTLTDQIYFEVKERDKLEALCRIIDIEVDFYGLIFCRTKRDVDEITEKLSERGYDAEGLHGDISQHQRERILDKFRKQLCNILIATDVASRGLDINNLTHVINYALPQDTESYIHRIGRTGRAGKQGTAITFITPSEYHKLIQIKKVTKTEIRKEQVPTIKNIIQSRQTRLKNKISALIEDNTIEQDYINFAKTILEKNDPAITLASVIKLAFEDEFNSANYADIQEGTSVDKQGQTRLFVARGKMDNMTPRKMVEYIERQSGVYGKRIDGVQVFDKFSFITVSFQDAEQILAAFKPQANQRSLIARAKSK